MRRNERRVTAGNCDHAHRVYLVEDSQEQEVEAIGTLLCVLTTRDASPVCGGKPQKHYGIIRRRIGNYAEVLDIVN